MTHMPEITWSTVDWGKSESSSTLHGDQVISQGICLFKIKVAPN